MSSQCVVCWRTETCHSSIPPGHVAVRHPECLWLSARLGVQEGVDFLHTLRQIPGFATHDLNTRSHTHIALYRIQYIFLSTRTAFFPQTCSIRSCYTHLVDIILVVGLPVLVGRGQPEANVFVAKRIFGEWYELGDLACSELVQKPVPR